MRRDSGCGGDLPAEKTLCVCLDRNIPVGVYNGAMHATLTALAEPNRFRIVELLRGGARAVGEIGERLSLQQPQVSKHLRVLKDVGIVEVEARAQQRLYQLRPAPLRELRDWIEGYRRIWEERFAELDLVIEDLKQGERKKKPTPSKRPNEKGRRQ